MNEIKIVLAVSLIKPYKRSLDPLLDLCNIWRCDLVYIGTNKRTQKIAMPWASFKHIWGFNPVLGEVSVPDGTEDYMDHVEVIDIVAYGKKTD